MHAYDHQLLLIYPKQILYSSIGNQSKKKHVHDLSAFVQIKVLNFSLRRYQSYDDDSDFPSSMHISKHIILRNLTHLVEYHARVVLNLLVMLNFYE